MANTLLFYRKDHFKPLKRDFNIIIQEFLSCFLFITLLRTDLPHIATMGRDETLQQTHFKALKRNHPKKRTFHFKINHKIPIPTI
ncbi:hypothetical protein HMPREF1393_00657 [Helicobacter pylori GAM103Bi]|nr:hypothetical protein HMPREF1393_00657 [Helicobacter pylori GAM103Bi]